MSKLRGWAVSFVSGAVEIAYQAMHAESPDLVVAYTDLVRCLVDNPDAARALGGRNRPAVGSAEYIRIQARSFASSRKLTLPDPPTTVPDELVSVVLVSHFGVPQAETARIKREHQQSMGAENIVGDLLERYLASVLEPEGWVWCSGATVKKVDFIKPSAVSGGPWRLLQVKNRDNSENSSSSSVRNGTRIEKWHRTFSRRGGTNWAAFPDPSLASQLSEEGFANFVTSCLASLGELDEN